MRIVIISPTKQQFNGLNYWKDKKTGYYKNSSHKPYSLHKAVWQYYFGKVPDGFVVDHIDRDKNNNNIENLRVITQSENNKNVSQETLDKRRKQVENIRELAKIWHKSEEGKKWHSEMAKESYKKRQKLVKICAHCGKEFETTDYKKATRFCGLNCKMKARTRRLKGLPEDYRF